MDEHLARCASCRGLERDLAAVTPEPARDLPAAATAAMFAQMDRELARAWSRPAPARTVGSRGQARLPSGPLLAYAALLMLTVAWGTYHWRAARSLELALSASHPITSGRVIPARAGATDLTSGQFAPAAWKPEGTAGER